MGRRHERYARSLQRSSPLVFIFQPMPRRSNLFQRLVLLINSSLAGNARVRESAMLTDKITGELREVDVLTTTNESSYEMQIAH
jgi:hypothetical protein